MKRLALAALAAALVAGAGAASATPFHGPVFHGPVLHGPVLHGPVGHGPVFHGPIGHGPVFGGHGFHSGPVWGGRFEPVGFHRWGYGEYLPRAFFAPDVYITDYVAYDLGAPPADCEWVRNGPDALLVNLDTGMVIQVVPGAFA
jgi:Ni/Co efflux regulator RcnB